MHLGLGAFSRAFIALYTEDAIKNTGGDWGIVGVSLRSSKVRNSLAAQDFTYTAAEVGPDQTQCRQVEIVDDILVVKENAIGVLQLMASPAIKIVSLTISEKGYCISPSTGKLDFSLPEIMHDVSKPLPVSAPGLLVRALEARKAAGHPPFTVLSCDNLPKNGQAIENAVLALSRKISEDLTQWIEENGCFPSSMADSITPATTSQDRKNIRRLTGFRDDAPVVHEPYTRWVIEDKFVNNERPDWQSAGVEFVSDILAYDSMKLRMLNGTHTALAYLGYLAGFETIADIVADDDFKKFTQMLWDKEIIPSLTPPPGVSLEQYANEAMMRYSNSSIRHLTSQVAMDGSQKLHRRILSSVYDRHTENAQTPGLILAIAAWMRYVKGVDEFGDEFEVHDPLAEQFAAVAKRDPSPDDWVASLLEIREVFPSHVSKFLYEPVSQTYLELLEKGAHEMVRKVVNNNQ